MRSNRFALVLLLAVLSLATPRAQARSLDLLTASIADIQAAVDAGRLTYEQLVGFYLRRIEAYDKQGPALRAVMAINPRALRAPSGSNRRPEETDFFHSSDLLFVLFFYQGV